MANIVDRFVAGSLVVLGLILMATPLALWVAWSKTVYFIVLLTGGVAAALYCFLVEREPPPRPQRQGPPYHRMEAWTDRTIARLRRLHPFIHHDRHTGGDRFNAAMNRIRRFLFSERD